NPMPVPPLVVVDVGEHVGVGHVKLAWRRVAVQVDPHASTRCHQQPSPWPAFSMRSRSSGEMPRLGAISYSSRASICPNHLDAATLWIVRPMRLSNQSVTPWVRACTSRP